MADSEKKKTAQSRITPDRRFRYIGFEVYPGKPKDLFKSDAERDKLVDAVKARRERGEVIRDDCILMEERVSGMDRIIMSLACVVMLASLFLPWFSVYNKIEERATTAEPEPIAAIADSTAGLLDSNSLVMTGDSLAAVASSEGEATTTDEVTATTTEVGDGSVVAGMEVGEEPPIDDGGAVAEQTSNEEVLHGYVAKKKFIKVYENVGGLGSLVSLGSIGSYVFSSGFILIITAILFMLMVLMSLGLPLYTLYGLFGLKGDEDKKALELKKIVRFNWLPLVTFTVAMCLSFLGANYGFDSEATFTSLGSSYGVGAFMDTLSWGVFVSIAMSILLAAKGSEI